MVRERDRGATPGAHTTHNGLTHAACNLPPSPQKHQDKLANDPTVLGIIDLAPKPHAQQQQPPPPSHPPPPPSHPPPPPSHPPPPSPKGYDSPETPQPQHAAPPAPWTVPARSDKFADKFAERGDGAARRVPNSRQRVKWTPEEARTD